MILFHFILVPVFRYAINFLSIKNTMYSLTFIKRCPQIAQSIRFDQCVVDKSVINLINKSLSCLTLHSQTHLEAILQVRKEQFGSGTKKTTPAQVPTKVCLSVTNADTMGFLLTIQNAKLCQDEVRNRVEFVAFLV